MPEEAPPPPELEAVHAVIRLFEALRLQASQALGASGSALSPLDMRVLMACYRAPGVNQMAIAQDLGREKGQVARLIRDLEAQGLLERGDDPADKRSYTLGLTAAGRRECRRFQALEEELAQRLFAAAKRPELATFVKVAREACERAGN